MDLFKFCASCLRTRGHLVGDPLGEKGAHSSGTYWGMKGGTNQILVGKGGTIDEEPADGEGGPQLRFARNVHGPYNVPLPPIFISHVLIFRTSVTFFLLQTVVSYL